MAENDLKSLFENLGLITQVGLVVVVSLLLGLGLGILAAKWTGGEAICRVAGVILGLGAGLYQAYRVLMEKIQ